MTFAKQKAGSLEEHLSPELIAKATQISDMQGWFEELKESNVDDLVLRLKESIFLKKEYIVILIDTVVSLASCRFELKELLVLVIQKILELDIEESIKDKIKSKLTKFPFKLKMGSSSYLLSRFVKKLIDSRIIEKSKLPKPPQYGYLKDLFDENEIMNDNFYPEGSAFLACKNNDIDRLTELAADPNFEVDQLYEDLGILKKRKSGFGNKHKLIEAAAMYGSVQCFKYLQVLGATIDDSIKNAAMCGGSLEIIRILDAEGIDFSDCAPLAASYFRHEIFDWVMENKVSCRATANAALIEAAETGDFYIMMKALDNGAKLNFKGVGRMTALQLCAENGHALMTEILASSPKCDVNFPLDYPPLFLACRQGHSKVVRILVEKGAKVEDVKISRNITPMWLAAESGSLSTVRFLVEETNAERDVLEKGHENTTPFLRAVHNGNLRIAKYLKDVEGVDVKATGYEKMNALHYAVELDNAEVVEFALTLGIDSSDTTKDEGHTPYSWAVINKKHVAKAILDGRDDICKEIPIQVIRNDVGWMLRHIVYFRDESATTDIDGKSFEECMAELEEKIKEYNVEPTILLKTKFQCKPCQEIIDWLKKNNMQIDVERNRYGTQYKIAKLE